MPEARTVDNPQVPDLRIPLSPRKGGEEVTTMTDSEQLQRRQRRIRRAAKAIITAAAAGQLIQLGAELAHAIHF